MKVGTILAALSPADRDRVQRAFVEIVACSFARDGARLTQAEAKRRGEICLRIFGVLRGDMLWATARALDHLPGYLRMELDGLPWEPSQRRVWIAGDP